MILVSWGLVIVLVSRAARERKVGPAVVRVRGNSTLRPVLLALCTGLALVVVRVPDFPVLPSLMTLGMSAALVLLSPSISDRVVGESGVSHGWTTFGYEEIESWSLARGALRFRFGGIWREIELPQDKQLRVRSLLSRQAGSREEVN